MKVTFYKARDGWRWRLRARNGRVVAESGEAYVRRAACVKAWNPAAWVGAEAHRTTAPVAVT